MKNLKVLALLVSAVLVSFIGGYVFSKVEDGEFDERFEFDEDEFDEEDEEVDKNEVDDEDCTVEDRVVNTTWSKPAETQTSDNESESVTREETSVNEDKQVETGIPSPIELN